MRATVLRSQQQPLELVTLPDPKPGPGQLLLEVNACGVCRTDLHLRDAEIPATKLPVVLGHQIVGTTADGLRVGVPWLGWTDGTCKYCTSGRENLCVDARFTGRDIDGGYAELTVADKRSCLPLPEELSETPGGGPVALRRTDRLPRPELHRRRGAAWAVRFGSAAHMICQLAAFQGRRGVRAHAARGRTHPGVPPGISGASWAGGSDEAPPEPLDAAIISRLPARSSRRRSRRSRPTESSCAPAFT